MSLTAALHPVLWFDPTAVRRAARPKPARQDAEGVEGQRLLCRNCGRPVTDEAERVVIAGQHAHTRSNPHGMSFCFGCFAAAPGCRILGRATGEHTWFPGCAWRIAVCGGCETHLGWLFSGAQRFFGLILDRLVSEDDRGSNA